MYEIGITNCIYVIRTSALLDGCVDTSWYFEKFGRGIGPISMYQLECTGGEHRLTDCSYIHNKNLITHTNDWSITCKNGKIVEISVASNKTLRTL